MPVISEIVTFTRASQATYFGANRVMQTAANNQWRMDHDPLTGAPRGVLIEESRTNLLTYSEQIDNAVHTRTRSTAVANVTTAPDGTLTADKLREDTTASATHLLAPTIQAGTNQTYVFSCFAKAAERSVVGLQISNNSTGAASIYFDLATGTIRNAAANGGDLTAAVGGLVDVGNGWYRCWISAVKGSVNSVVAPYVNLHNGVNVAYTGDGTSGLYLWGIQIEVGAFPTSYIPTTTAVATRAADQCAVPVAGWFNTIEGTFLVEASTQVATGFALTVDRTTGAYGPRFQLGMASLVNGLRLDVVEDSGAVVAALTSSGQFGKASAFAYKTNDFAFSAGGAAASVDTTGGVPTGLTALQVGRGPVGAFYLNGHVKRITYWPSRLTNTELQALTS